MSISAAVARRRELGAAWLARRGWAERAAWLAAAAAAVVGAWTGNALEAAWSSASWGLLAPWRAQGIRAFWFPLALFVGSFLVLYSLRAHLARPRTRRLTTDTSPRPRPCLVLLLSAIGRPRKLDELSQIEPKQRNPGSKTETPILGGATLDEDIERLLKAKQALPPEKPVRWPWEMALRAVRHNYGSKHRPVLQHIVLIGSDSTSDDLRWGSVFQAKAFGNLLARYASLASIQVHLLVRDADGVHILISPDSFRPQRYAGFNFETFDELSDALLELFVLLGAEGVSEHDIVIDFTGGQKPTSVVAAAVTLNRPVETQYVQTNPPYDVIGYDLILGGGPDQR